MNILTLVFLSGRPITDNLTNGEGLGEFPENEDIIFCHREKELIDKFTTPISYSSFDYFRTWQVSAMTNINKKTSCGDFRVI